MFHNNTNSECRNDNDCDIGSNTADVVATLRGLRQRESKYYNRSSMFQFLQREQQQQQGVRENSVDTTELYWGSWRRQMIAWQFSLANACDFHADTIEVAMSVVDRFVAVQKQLLHQANRYQVACVASFYIAVKIHQSQCLTPDQLQTLSGGRFQASDIEAMELEILRAIQWRVNSPTIAASCEFLVQLIPSSMLSHSVQQQVLEVALSLIPLVLPEESLATESVLALGLACIGNALRYVLPTVNHHYNYNHQLYRTIMQFFYHHLETEVDLYRTDRLQFQVRSLVHKSLSSGVVLHPVLAEENDTFFSEENMATDNDDDDQDKACRDDETCHTSPRSVGGIRRYMSILLG